MTPAPHNILKEIHYYVGKHVKVPIHPHLILNASHMQTLLAIWYASFSFCFSIYKYVCKNTPGYCFYINEKKFSNFFYLISFHNDVSLRCI